MSAETLLSPLFQKAAEYLHHADALLITAGSGMGVDSGLPDFRSDNGFWKAYPALGKNGVHFESIASAKNFIDAPEAAWGFYGHRLNLYREITPHIGFELLKVIADHMTNGYFVFTSNVDGQFQKAGFHDEKILECHGSIHYLQCSELRSEDDCHALWSAEKFLIDTDDSACRSLSELPYCPHCGSIARPNILMFSDFAWLPYRSIEQRERYDAFLQQADNLVIIEIGAGTAIPTVRYQSNYHDGPLIRINPRESEINKLEGVPLSVGGLEAIKGIYHAYVAMW